MSDEIANDVLPDEKQRLPWKKILLVFGVLFVGLTVLAFQDAEEPSYPEFEEVRVEVEESENAVPGLLGLSVADFPTTMSEMLKGDTEWDSAKVKVELKVVRAELDLWTEALKKEQWQQEEVTDFTMAVPYLNQWQKVMKWKRLEARLLWKEGRKDEALALMEELLLTGQRMEASDGVLIIHLVGMVSQSLGLTEMKEMTDVSTLSDEQLARLELSLRDLELDPELFAECFAYEYQGFANTLDNLRGKDIAGAFGTNLGGLESLFLRPNRTKKLYGDTMLRNMQAASEPVYRDAKFSPEMGEVMRKKGTWRSFLSTNATGNTLLAISLPAYGGIAKRHAEARTRVRLLRLRLALERYHRAEGKLPGGLDELVPAYLNEALEDPFSGKAFLYDPISKRIWSVGSDGADALGVSRKPDEAFGDDNEPNLELEFAE